MQPYFFPYVGYFSLIKHTDKFILFDTVQFIRHGWIERNRILKQNEGWLYIKVPLLKGEGRFTIIKDVLINNKENWKNKITSQIIVYKKTAPYYYQVKQLIEMIFNHEFKNIVELDKFILESILLYLGIQKKIEVFSEMSMTIDDADAPDEWALNICKSLGTVKEYWNPSGGISFFDKSKYTDSKIDLKFQKMKLVEYNQKRPIFEPGLSIIDVLMFNSVEKVNILLDNFELK